MSIIKANNLISLDGTYNIDVKDITPIGVGQTWQDVTASRAINTLYTNNTGKPIQVFVRIDSNGVGGADWGIEVNGVTILGQFIFTSTSTYFWDLPIVIIPNGDTYEIVGSPYPSSTWLELR